MKNQKVKSITLTSAVILSTVLAVTAVHAESGPGGISGKRTPFLLDKSATRSGDFRSGDPRGRGGFEDKFATGSNRGKIGTHFGELKDKLASRSGEKKERLTNLADNLVKRLTSITDRQDNILKRANARIASMSAEGKNVADLNARAASISGMIAKQRTSIAALKTTLQAITTSNNSGTTVGKTISDVVKQVTATHRALQDLIKAMGLKGPQGSNRPDHSFSPRPSRSPKASSSSSASPVASVSPTPEVTAL